MVWFKVDDKFHAHPKRYQCSLAAIGLWSVAGSWCGDRENGGTIPAHMLAAFGATPRLAAELVTARLWDERADGWQFHDWTDQNFSAEQMRAKRERDAERKRKWREAKASQRDSAWTDEGTDNGLTPESALTRPDPTRPEGVKDFEGDRPVTLRAAHATDHSQNWTTPTDARCTAHVGVGEPGPCQGCRAAREREERKLDREADKRQREAKARELGCDRCDGANEVDPETKMPTNRKCDHTRRAS